MRFTRLSRSILLWVVLLVGLIAVLVISGVDSVVFGGALGAFVGATLVMVYAARERAAISKKPDSRPPGRYGRR